jgi:LAO/AO transport system kinase
MVDFFLLVLVAGAGDELQGIKKGVVELADAIAINKSDGDNIQMAEIARNEYSKALHYLTPITEGWKPDAYTISALTGDGIDQLWNVIKDFEHLMKESGVFYKRRSSQKIDWVKSMVETELINRFYNSKEVSNLFSELKDKILNEKILAVEAAEKLLNINLK